jgi:hypothetical protein
MMRLLLLPAPLLLLFATASAQDILVVAPDDLARSIDAWRKHRERQGHVVAVKAPAEDLPALVRAVHGGSGGALRFVLLLGDVTRVPCTYVPADTIRPWEKDPRVATDNHAADVDGDDVPDLAIGRIPADTPAEAEAMLGRMIAYETSGDFGPWQRRVNVIAGVAGFGWPFDQLIELASTKFLRENVPPAYDLHVTWANAASPFCPPPAAVADVAVERFNEGALFLAYIGHGSARSLDALRFEDRAYRIFDEDDVERLAARHPPVAFLCCCSTGHMDGAPDCLAEFALKRAGGPIAVVAASRVSMPYSNGILGKEMLDALFAERVATVGEMLLVGKRRLVQPEPGDQMRIFFDTLARQWKPRPEDLAAERKEHLFLYNLFGDPALRLPRPGEVTLECASAAAAGGRLAVNGRCDVAGDVLLELVADRTPDVPKRAGDTDEDFAACYARANAWVRAQAKARCDGKAFQAEIAVPADIAPGAFFVRAYVTGGRGSALGARAVEVKPAPKPAATGSR